MLNNFRKLYAYNEWANCEALESLRAAPAASSRALRFLGHIVASERLWHTRLKAQSTQGFNVWPEWSIEQCAEELTQVIELWDAFVPGLTAETLSDVIAYSNTKGETWQNTVADVLTHVIIHSGYHRGQVAAEVRGSGGEPAYSDFIHAVRKGLVKPKALIE